ncbi:MAG: hypothetical protein CL712_00110 [Chloroflexi bacterium]|nr:hypothetical protein [Chloroflexota bacterium]
MKLAVCILAHHKPWLIMSTIATLFLQENKEFDLHIIYIKGDGDNRDKKSYEKFYEIADKDGDFNPQMSPDDNRIIELLDDLGVDIKFHEVRNDHGLDSSAWYKFIQKGVWKDYDHSMFLMEGSIFTSDKVLSAINSFQKEIDLDFLSVGHEKRFLPYSIFTNFKKRNIERSSEMDIYHTESMNLLLEEFCKCREFKSLLDDWSSPNSKYTPEVPITQHHVPSSIYSSQLKIKFFIKSLIRKKKILGSFKTSLLEVSDGEANFKSINSISNNIRIHSDVIFHEEVSPYFFGCSCQHVFSRRFLESLNNKLQEFNLYEAIDRPFSGTSLELIWGFMPKWLGYKKWFFNGIHRPRKDFLTYMRNDDIHGVSDHLNSYFKKSIKVIPKGDFLSVVALKESFKSLEKQFSRD